MPAANMTGQQPQQQQKKYYISITGLRLKSMLYLPKFMYYTKPAFQQAVTAPGNISAKTDYVNGVLHTFTVWEDRISMTRFMAKGVHAAAMKISDSISTKYGTKVYGYESDTIPTWEEVLQIWDKKGARHGALVPTTKPKRKVESNAASGASHSFPLPSTKIIIPMVLVAAIGVAAAATGSATSVLA